MRSPATAVAAVAALLTIGGGAVLGCTDVDDGDAATSDTIRADTSGGTGDPSASSTSQAAPLDTEPAGATDPPTTASTSSTAAAPPTTTNSTTNSATDDAIPPARLGSDLDAGELAARLSTSHATMTDPAAIADDRARAGVEHQLILRQLAERPDLDDEVLDALEPAARPAVEAIVRARQFLQERTASRPPQPLPDELPGWTIVEPEPIDTLLAHYADAEQRAGIPWYWLAAIHLQETRMGRIKGVSTAGAVGPMQFLPTTWAQCCSGDPAVTRDAIIGAATYLAQSGGPDDMASALYQYNPNDGYVAVVTAYAETLRDEPELYVGYHAFQVFFGSSAGTVRLPVGYSESSPIDAAAYLASNPQDAG